MGIFLVIIIESLEGYGKNVRMTKDNGVQMKKKETISVDMTEIIDTIKDDIRKKYDMDENVQLHYTSKTSFLTFTVVRDNKSFCDCDDCTNI